MHDFLLIVIFAVVFGVIFLIMREVEKQNRAKLEALSGLLEAPQIKAFFGTVSLYGLYGGNPLRISLEPGSRRGNQAHLHFGSEDSGTHHHNRPPTLRVFLSKPLSADFIITHDNPLFGLGKMVGLLKDLETGDPVFDKEYLVQGKDRQAALSYFSSEKLEAIKALEFTLLKLDKSGAQYSHDYYREEELEPEAMKATLERLEKLAVI